VTCGEEDELDILPPVEPIPERTDHNHREVDGCHGPEHWPRDRAPYREHPRRGDQAGRDSNGGAEEERGIRLADHVCIGDETGDAPDSDQASEIADRDQHTNEHHDTYCPLVAVSISSGRRSTGGQVTSPTQVRSLPWLGTVTLRTAAEEFGRSWRDVVSLAIAFVGAIVVTRYGTEAYWAAHVGVASTVPLLLTARSWRLPLWVVVLAAALPTSIIAVSLATGGDGIGADRATRYGYGAALFLAVVAWATSSRRRLVVAAGAGVVILDQYATAWFPWWGGGDPQHLMWGTFYWHNQFGIFCGAGTAIGLGLALLGTRLWALLGTVVAVFSIAGVLASGSRACLMLTAIAVVCISGLAIRLHGLRGLLRSVIAIAGSLTTATVLSSSLFFPTGQWPWAAVVGRSADGTIGLSGATRLDFWLAGLQIGAAHPLLGGGLLSFGPRSLCIAAPLHSTNPHNEWILAWAEGGALALLPMLAVLSGLVVLVLRSVRPALTSRPGSDPARWGAIVAAAILIAHAAIDFDWAFTALVGMAGIVLGVASAPLIRTRDRSTVPLAIAATLIVALLASGFFGHLVDTQWNTPLRGASIDYPCASAD